MREIKFRAWDKKLNKWIDGAYGFHILGEAMLIGGLFQGYLKDLASLRLNDIVLMQFTGLKDKNNKEIYEGDIVQWDNNVIHSGAVEFLPGSWMVRMCKGSLKGVCGWYLNTVLNYNLEVIGNIYESRELLNGQ